MKRSKWNKFLNGEIPFVVLSGVLYRTDRGQVRKAWMDVDTCECHTQTPIERVGVVPEKYRTKLKDTATELTKIGMVPLPMPEHKRISYSRRRRKGGFRG